MPKHPFVIKQIGRSPRDYDNAIDSKLTDLKALQDTSKNLKKILQWDEVSIGDQIINAKNSTEPGLRFFDNIGAIPGVNNLPLVQGFQNAPALQAEAKKIRLNLRNRFRDLFSKRRRKTSLLIIAGILLGFAGGAIIGTLFFPGIGSALGAAAGAALGASAAATVVAAVPWAIATFTVMLTAFTTWIANKIAKKAFKDELNYELSKEVTRKFKKTYGLKGKDIDQIHAYILNREQTVKSNILKNTYTRLRQSFLTGAPGPMQKVVLFYINELILLSQEYERARIQKDDVKLAQIDFDIKVVLHILEKFEVANGVDLKSRMAIAYSKIEFSNTKKDFLLTHEDLIPYLTHKTPGLEPIPSQRVHRAKAAIEGQPRPQADQPEEGLPLVPRKKNIPRPPTKN